MKKLLTSALAAALVAAGTGSEAQAQDMVGRRASLFDLGISGGGAYTSSWFEIDDEAFGVGFSPAFGVGATFWANPSLGVRLHGSYLPTQLPQAANRSVGSDPDKLAVNNYFYDLSLVFRPFFANPGFMGGTYFWLGGGGLTSNVAGKGPAVRFGFPCVGHNAAGFPAGLYINRGICLSYDPEYASVGQATAGLGFDVFPLTSNIGFFGELGLHAYDSPAHDIRGNAGAAGTDDRFAFTGTGMLGLKFMFGDILPPPPPALPPPPPPTVVEQPRTQTQDIQVCVVQDGMLTTVTGQFNPATGDTMVAGQRFATAYPATGPTYAAGQTWFINNETVTIGNERYVRFGLPRVIGTTEVTRRGEFQGTPLFIEAGATGTPEVIYIPVRPGCEFQPYQRQAKVQVRG